jgi:hypothetical protein
VVGSIAGLYTRGIHDFFFVNRNLNGPVGTDRHGRLLYGSVDSLGVHPSLISSTYSEVISLENQSRNYSYALTLSLQKRFSNSVEASVAYRYLRVRDVASNRYLAYLDGWRGGRVLSGDQEATGVGISDFDQPHRLIAVGTFTFPWQKWRTDLSFYYIGSSGVPYTYTATGAPLTGFGDLNADGAGVNDPIYVPRNAADTSEIQFRATQKATVASQQQTLEQFIAATPCLTRERGRILERNSCRSPWISTLNLSVRQAMPSLGRHSLSVELQGFNLLNLLSPSWGRVWLPNGNPTFAGNVGLLQQVGQTAGPSQASQPIFQLSSDAMHFSLQNPASSYQLQIGARYAF